MSEFFEINELTEAVYEALARDYESDEFQIKELVDKYNLNPIYKKRSLFQLLKKRIKSDKKCPNCGEFMYRPVRSRNGQYDCYKQDDYICKNCGHFNDEENCECDSCKAKRKNKEERIKAKLQELQDKEDFVIAKRLFLVEKRKNQIHAFLVTNTNQTRYFKFEELSLKHKIFRSCLCSTLKMINQSGILLSLENQDATALNTIFPRIKSFSIWLKECIFTGLISVDPNSPLDSFGFNDDIGSVRYITTKVNLKIMIEELNDNDNYIENLEKIKSLNYSFSNVSIKEVKHLWSEIGAQEILAYMNERLIHDRLLELDDSLFTTVKPEIIEGEKKYFSNLIEKGLSIAQTQSVVFSAFRNVTDTQLYKEFLTERGKCADSSVSQLDYTKLSLINSLQFQISDIGAMLLTGRKEFKGGHRQFSLRQSSLSFTFFDVFLGMDNLVDPNVDFFTACKDEIIQELLENRESANEPVGYDETLG